jgi:ADP-heptose:LPS heptosyltransferase
MTNPVFDVAGKTTMRGFAALARRALVVVALDSGPMHIAAAAGAPTVGIFALRTDLPQRWRPIGPRVAIIEPDYPCPGSCRKETCRTFACYAALSPERVVAAARQIASPSPSEVA